MNQVVLVGRLTRDPELRYIPGTGTPVASFTIAIDRDYVKKDGSKETDFIPVEVMGKSAEFCANYITKGRLVALQGSIRVDNYQTQSGERELLQK
ncbi:single-stranded DNA-binding family protein [Clostridioides difficile DA00183]|nr:single-stranded DNA-binding protein [Clostridioides difficile]EQG79461.1 single-stranded DNA-binding family protein [Clostridioides difficile DA00183]